jgi:hypothetical protein
MYDTIICTLKGVWGYVIHSYICSIRKDRIPNKNRVLELVERYIHEHMACWKKDALLAQIENVLSRVFLMESSVLLYGLSMLPSDYVHYLNREFFNDLEKINTLDGEFNINWLVEPLTLHIKQSLKRSLGTTEGLLYDWLIDELKD